MNLFYTTLFLVIIFYSPAVFCAISFPLEIQNKIICIYGEPKENDTHLREFIHENTNNKNTNDFLWRDWQQRRFNTILILGQINLDRILVIRQVCTMWNTIALKKFNSIDNMIRAIIEPQKNFINSRSFFSHFIYQNFAYRFKKTKQSYTLALPIIFALEKDSLLVDTNKISTISHQEAAEFIFKNLTDEKNPPRGYSGKNRTIKPTVNLSLDQFKIILEKSKKILSLYKHHLVVDKTIEQRNRLYWDYSWLLIKLIHHFKFAEQLIEQNNIEKKYMLKYMYYFIIKYNTKECAHLFLMNWLWRGGFKNHMQLSKEMLQEMPLDTFFYKSPLSETTFLDFPTIYDRVLQANYNFLFDYISNLDQQLGCEFLKKWFEYEWYHYQLHDNNLHNIRNKMCLVLLNVNHLCPLFVKINTGKTIYEHLSIIDKDETFTHKANFSLRLPLLRRYLKNATNDDWEKDGEELENIRDDIIKIKRFESLRNTAIFIMFLLVLMDYKYKKPTHKTS